MHTVDKLSGEGAIPRITRRQFVKRAAVTVFGAGAATGLYTWRVEPHWLEIVHRPMRLTHLPEELEGRTLAFLSDLHVGPRVDDDYVVGVLQKVALTRPDFVAIAGDFISYRGPEQLDQLKQVLAHMPHGRLATVASLGNHDYGPAWSHPEIADRVAAVVEAAGIQVLRNKAVQAGGLQLAGVDDLWGGRFAPKVALAALDAHGAAIVLSHNPDTVDLAGWDGYRGWILSGHTHGGQCKPPFLPPPLLPVKNLRYTSGEFDLDGGRRLYISRGVGHLIRVRFNVRPEVTIFRLTRDA